MATSGIPPFVLIYWHDAHDLRKSWVTEDQADDFLTDTCKCLSFGFLIREDKECYVIAADYGDCNWGRVTKVPKGMVKSVKTIIGKRALVQLLKAMNVSEPEND